METGVTLRRDSVGLKTIAPGASDTFEYTLLSDGNSEQTLDIIIDGSAAEWATSSISEAVLEAGGGTTFIVTVAVPEGTSEATYRLEVLVMNGDQELALSVSNVVVQVPIDETVNIVMCLTDMSGFCLTSGEFEVTIEASKIQTASVGFLIENRGEMDAEIAFELMMPDGSTGSDLYFDENSKEWRVAVSPADTTTYPLDIDAGETMDWGALAVIAREVLPGSYTFTLKLMLATETDSGTYVFETLEQVTITVIVEGDEPQGETESEDDSLLPGPSFLSVILILATIVYRRRRLLFFEVASPDHGWNQGEIGHIQSKSCVPQRFPHGILEVAKDNRQNQDQYSKQDRVPETSTGLGIGYCCDCKNRYQSNDERNKHRIIIIDCRILNRYDHYKHCQARCRQTEEVGILPLCASSKPGKPKNTQQGNHYGSRDRDQIFYIVTKGKFQIIINEIQGGASLNIIIQ